LGKVPPGCANNRIWLRCLPKTPVLAENTAAENVAGSTVFLRSGFRRSPFAGSPPSSPSGFGTPSALQGRQGSCAREAGSKGGGQQGRRAAREAGSKGGGQQEASRGENPPAARDAPRGGTQPLLIAPCLLAGGNVGDFLTIFLGRLSCFATGRRWRAARVADLLPGPVGALRAVVGDSVGAGRFEALAPLALLADKLPSPGTERRLSHGSSRVAPRRPSARRGQPPPVHWYLLQGWGGGCEGLHSPLRQHAPRWAAHTRMRTRTARRVPYTHTQPCTLLLAWLCACRRQQVVQLVLTGGQLLAVLDPRPARAALPMSVGTVKSFDLKALKTLNPTDSTSLPNCHVVAKAAPQGLHLRRLAAAVGTPVHFRFPPCPLCLGYRCPYLSPLSQSSPAIATRGDSLPPLPASQGTMICRLIPPPSPAPSPSVPLLLPSPPPVFPLSSPLLPRGCTRVPKLQDLN
jgi:hypothetical protein